MNDSEQDGFEVFLQQHKQDQAKQQPNQTRFYCETFQGKQTAGNIRDPNDEK